LFQNFVSGAKQLALSEDEESDEDSEDDSDDNSDDNDEKKAKTLLVSLLAPCQSNSFTEGPPWMKRR
jgi:hypothetical protein